MNSFKDLNIDNSWILFLDRDGVINRRIIDDYVKNINEFDFLPGTLEAIAKFTEKFGRIFIVTNQRGIARGLMSKEDLAVVHEYMLKHIEEAGGKIDEIYFCPHDRDEDCGCRKPAPGMAHRAKKEFPEVDFSKSIMVGDSDSDIGFGKNAGMVTVKITTEEYDGLKAESLQDFASRI